MPILPARPTYTRRGVPRDAAELPAWLNIELHNLQRAVAPYRAVTVTAAYTATQNDGLVLCDTAAGAFTVTIPDPARAQGQVLTVKKLTADANAVTLAATNGTIDGASTKSLAAQWNSKTMASDGVAWYITATV